MYSKNSGFTIIEVLIAIVVMTAVLLWVFSIIKSTQVRTQASHYATDMTILAQNGIEIASDNLKNNWDAITPGDYKAAFDESKNNWELVPGDETGLESKFTRKISITNACRDSHGEIIQNNPCSGTVDENSKIIKVSVSWMKSGLGSPVTAELLVINS